MAPVALAFAVLDASGSATDLGVVLAARMVPLLAFLLVGGAVADRFSRRMVLIVSNLGSALTQGAVAVLLLTHNYSLGTVAVLELLNGVLTAFTTPALRGVVPELMGKEHLRQANSLLGTVKNATKVLGPSASGLLVVAVGSGWAIAFDSITFLLAAACLARLPLGGRVPSRKSSVLGDIRDGWAVFRRIRWVWVVTLSFGVVNLVQTGTWQILGPQLTQELSNKAVWGFVLSARGVGLLLMGALMYKVASRHLLRFGLVMGVLGALPFVVLGAAAGTPLLIVAAFVGGMGSSVLMVSWDTSLQEHVPAQTLSRVSSYDNLLSYLAIPIGQLAVGPLAAAFGGYQVMLIAGVVYAVAAAVPLLSASVRQLPHEQRQSEKTAS